MTLKLDLQGNLVQASRPALCQNLVIGGGSVASAAFSTRPTGQSPGDGTPIVAAPNHTMHIRLCSTSNCWVAFGSAPVAVASGALSIYLPANVPEYFWVTLGERVAVVQDTAAGVLNIGELTS